MYHTIVGSDFLHSYKAREIWLLLNISPFRPSQIIKVLVFVRGLPPGTFVQILADVRALHTSRVQRVSHRLSQMEHIKVER